VAVLSSTLKYANVILVAVARSEDAKFAVLVISRHFWRGSSEAGLMKCEVWKRTFAFHRKSNAAGQVEYPPSPRLSL
jgi:hypothetical protein